LASGSSGIILRNGIDYQVTQGLSGFIEAASFYAAIDYGRVFGQREIDVKSAHAIGGTFGVKLRNTTYNFDVSYQEILSVSGHMDAPGGIYLASFELVF
jgi:hemolysin activation/secretion protein